MRDSSEPFYSHKFQSSYCIPLNRKSIDAEVVMTLTYIIVMLP